MTASFMKELVRRAVLIATDDDLAGAVQEMLAEVAGWTATSR
ncbi:hypothetical protein AB0M54_08910 [Actinoplanes sp. NPDC051470]